MFVILCVAVHSAKHRLPWGMIPFPVTMTWAYFLMSFRCGFHVDQYGFGPSLTTLYTMVGNLYSTDHRAADDQSGKSVCEPKSNKFHQKSKIDRNSSSLNFGQFKNVRKQGARWKIMAPPFLTILDPSHIELAKAFLLAQWFSWAVQCLYTSTVENMAPGWPQERFEDRADYGQWDTIN